MSEDPVLDAHVHLWDTRRRRLPWLPPGHPLRRDRLPADLARATAGRVGAVLLVQADADPAEVGDLLDLAAAHSRRTPAVAGVVGWFDLTAAAVAGRIAAAAKHAARVDAHLAGVRCPPADQTDPASLTAHATVRGVRAAAEAGLAVDLLLRPPALTGAARLAAAVPDARFVLDHLGNPRGDAVDPAWAAGLAALAEQPNVAVKLSGLTAIAPGRDAIRRHVEQARELFGTDRLLYGSDWPVCTLTTDHPSTIDLVADLLPAADHADVFGATARRVYRLGTADTSTAPPSGSELRIA